MLAEWFKEADVICGDMNCSPAGSDAAPLLKAGFKSALSTESTFHGFDSQRVQPQTIDHVWLGRNTEFRDADVWVSPSSRKASDHWPVLAHVLHSDS